jgi:hypothetical protein
MLLNIPTPNHTDEMYSLIAPPAITFLINQFNGTIPHFPQSNDIIPILHTLGSADGV